MLPERGARGRGARGALTDLSVLRVRPGDAERVGLVWSLVEAARRGRPQVMDECSRQRLLAAVQGMGQVGSGAQRVGAEGRFMVGGSWVTDDNGLARNGEAVRFFLFYTF